jgi:hypothetical protein
VLSKHLRRWIEENHEKSQAIKPVSKLGFEPRISQILFRSVHHSTMIFIENT